MDLTKVLLIFAILIFAILMFSATFLIDNKNVTTVSGKHFPSETIQVDGIDSVVRFVDPVNNVVCYSASRYSVSCVPISKPK